MKSYFRLKKKKSVFFPPNFSSSFFIVYFQQLYIPVWCDVIWKWKKIGLFGFSNFVSLIDFLRIKKSEH
jgi:hypothetical protein